MAQATPDVSLDSFANMKPAPLVALVGMQGLHDSLTSRRLQSHPDEHAPRYISLEINTGFLDHQPGSGAGQESVILKRDWLHKHTYVSAAVVCLWFDFGSGGDIVSTWLGLLESFRARCRPNCKIVVVILQSAKEGPLSPGVDERVTTLRRASQPAALARTLTRTRTLTPLAPPPCHSPAS